MSASPIARQATQSQSIPSKRIVIHDPNQLPADYSSTPGGTLYSTTPGGQFIRLLHVFFLSHLNAFFLTSRMAPKLPDSIYPHDEFVTENSHLQVSSRTYI